MVLDLGIEGYMIELVVTDSLSYNTRSNNKRLVQLILSMCELSSVTSGPTDVAFDIGNALLIASKYTVVVSEGFFHVITFCNLLS